MSLLTRSDALHADVRAFAAGAHRHDFAQLARAIAEFQAEFSAGFARLLATRPGALSEPDWLPGVPSEAFRLTRVAVHPAELDVVRFVTSGTSGDERGVHALRSTETYRALAVPFGASALLASALRPHVVALAPAPTVPPSSSLGFMMALFMDHFDAAGAATDDAAQRFLLGPGGLDLAGLERAAQLALDSGRPLLVLATSFALVELLDRLGPRTLGAPAHTTVMQTGGFKGKSREIPADELRAGVARAFAIPERQIVSEYGMTELTSQMYEASLPGSALAALHAGPPGRYYEPPWLRVVPVDPTTLEPVPDGEIGIAKIIDLANVDSALCIQTRDQVRRSELGFELLGRAAGAPPRGCSLAIEEFLAGTRAALGSATVSLPSAVATSTLHASPRRPSSPGSDEAARRARITPLLAAARAIADARHPLGQRARLRLAQRSDLSAQGLEFALQNCLETTPSEAELLALVACTPESPHAHVLLSAGVFTAALRAIAIGLASAARVSVRPSRRDPEMARLLLEGAAGAFELVDELSPEAGDHVWAYGRDETLDQLAQRLAVGATLHRHGAGFGVALLERAEPSELQSLMAALARDVALFDQRGCLSPRVLLVQGSAQLAERAASELTEALATLEARVPLGRLYPEELAAISEYRDSARYLGQLAAAGRGFVSLGSSQKWLLPPIGRNVHVLRTDDALPPLTGARRYITTVALEGGGELERALRQSLPGARVARFGGMQSPRFDGPVDRRLG